MEIGKALAAAPWRAHAIDYQHLQQLANACALPLATASRRTDEQLRKCPLEAAFFAALVRQIHRANAHYHAQLRLCKRQLHALCAAIITADGPLSSSLWRCELVRRTLWELEQFSAWNTRAVVCILEKHDEWTGFCTSDRFQRAVLMRQPVANVQRLVRMRRCVHTTALAIRVLLHQSPLNYSSQDEADATTTDEDSDSDSVHRPRKRAAASPLSPHSSSKRQRSLL